jgi:hypothetical protein
MIHENPKQKSIGETQKKLKFNTIENITPLEI